MIYIMNQGQASPRKNLWRSINHERSKYSGVEQTTNTPALSNSKQSNHNSQPLRNLHNNIKPSNNLDMNLLQSKFQSVSKQVEFDEYEQDNEYGKQSSSKYYLNTKPVLHDNNQNKQKNMKPRKFSIGQQSIVQEIVDFKNAHNLDICDYQQDQQPMIMSLGSQSNPGIRQLKLSKVKDDLQKLQNFRKEFLNYIKDQKLKYQQYFQKNFHELISYVLQHYYNKLEQSQQQLHDRIDIDHNQFVSPITLKNRISHDEETPRFPKRLLLQKSNSKLEYSQLLEQKTAQIQKLQQELFKIKLENQDYVQRIQKLNEQNKILKSQNHLIQEQIQQIHENQFDFDQKVAQLEIQVEQKVQKIVQKRLLEAKKNDQKELQHKYLASVNQKQIVIQELDSIVEQVAKRQERIREKQKQFREKEKNFNELVAQFNSQKLDFQINLQKFQVKQAEFRSQQVALQQKQLELALKQKQFHFKFNEIQKNKQSQIFRKNQSSLKATNLHKKTQSEQQKYYYDQFYEDQQVHKQQVDFKVYNIRPRNRVVEQNYIYRQPQQNYNTPTQSTNPNINLNLNLNNIGRFKQPQSKVNPPFSVVQLGKNWKYNHLLRQSQHQSIKSQKGSKQKNKNNNITNNALVSPKYNFPINRSIAINRQTNKTFTQGGTRVQNNYSSTNYKSQDKNRLEDLGSKLQNLRNQIRKQIHDMD